MLGKLKKKIKGTLNRYGAQHARFRAGTRAFFQKYWWLHNAADTFYIKTNPKMAVFASFEGRAYSDSPKALFEYMVQSGLYDDFTFVWGFKSGAAAYEKQLSAVVHAAGVRRGGRMPRLIVVRYNSVEWRKYQARAGYWVFNFKIADYLVPKKDQVFLQLWHGTPLKRLGFDLEHFDSATNTQEGIQRRYAKEVRKFTYFLTACPYATQRFLSAWRMEDFGKADCIIEDGYPRDDILVNYTPEDVSRIKGELLGYYYEDYEKRVKRRKIILYAPTYRADEYEVGKGHQLKLAVDFDRMCDELGEDYIILFRAHYFVAQQYDFSRYRGFVYNVSDVDDINDLYLISDLMITDYSSSMFDFAILERPMIFYMYDLAHYRDASNGFYFDPHKELPGPIVETQDALFEAIRRVDENALSYAKKYRRFNEKFNPNEDGHHSERLAARVFGRSADGARSGRR